MTLSARKKAIASHFAKAKNYNQHAQIQAEICRLLSAKLITDTTLNSALEVGAGKGLFTQQLNSNLTVKHWHINELCSQNIEYLQQILPAATFYFGDAESLPFLSEPATGNTDKSIAGFDLIASANTVQWFDKPLGFVDSAIPHLKKGGQLLFNSFTPNNFNQIKKLTGQGLNYPSVQEWQNKLHQYSLTDSEVLTHTYELIFESPLAVLKHIKYTGVSVNVNNNFRWTRQSLEEFDSNYRQYFSTQDGQVILSYEAIIISAIK